MVVALLAAPAAWAAEPLQVTLLGTGNPRPSMERFGPAIYEAAGVTITAFEVDHGDGIVPAYGYRIDYGEHSAAFSGDMRYDERIVAHAKGVDLLVMEVISVEVELARAAVKSEAAIAKVISHHISPEQAGSLFARIKPRLAVYSHIVPSPAAAEDLIPPTRRAWAGPLAVGYDLMTIRIGETVEVYPRPVVADD